jgi:hypothetical protein
VTGRVKAVAVNGEHLFVATKEGNLWRIDLPDGKPEDLGAEKTGQWWSAIRMAVEGDTLHIATIPGRLWDVDWKKAEKSLVENDGFDGTTAMTVK